ncbi:hypothetical protein [Aquimarina aquimarini]|uniref:hypothetical protein n=1 Tax=Aquimarina aquimarini TaxID=1191734 RepID=UPI000D561D82|nr:hypothetical protein [Aquimarina aquimarini]
MTFIFFLAITFFYTIILGVYNRYAFIHSKKYIRFICISVALLSLVAGISQGTLYSHGLDIPWWVFSAINFVIGMVAALIIVGLMKVIFFKQRK